MKRLLIRLHSWTDMYKWKLCIKRIIFLLFFHCSAENQNLKKSQRWANQIIIDSRKIHWAPDMYGFDHRRHINLHSHSFCLLTHSLACSLFISEMLMISDIYYNTENCKVKKELCVKTEWVRERERESERMGNRLKKITHVSSLMLIPSSCMRFGLFLTHIALHNWLLWLVWMAGFGAEAYLQAAEERERGNKN
jgi:hypothetical protein